MEKYSLGFQGPGVGVLIQQQGAIPGFSISETGTLTPTSHGLLGTTDKFQSRNNVCLFSNFFHGTEFTQARLPWVRQASYH